MRICKRIIADMQEDLEQERARERVLPGVSMLRSAQRGVAHRQRVAPINAAGTGTRSCGKERRQTFAAARIGSEELPVRRRRGAAKSRARSGDGCEERRRGAAARSGGGGEVRRRSAAAESKVGGEELR